MHYMHLPLLCCEDPKFLGHSLVEMQIYHPQVVVQPIIPNFWDCHM